MFKDPRTKYLMMFTGAFFLAMGMETYTHVVNMSTILGAVLLLTGLRVSAENDETTGDIAVAMSVSMALVTVLVYIHGFVVW